MSRDEIWIDTCFYEDKIGKQCYIFGWALVIASQLLGRGDTEPMLAEIILPHESRTYPL